MNYRAITWISWMAGVGDFVTGLMLVCLPEMTLQMMGVPAMRDTVLVRYIGVFVGCVGVSYLFALYLWWCTGSIMRLRVTWELTTLFRAAVGGFVLLQVVTNGLPAPWLLVTGVDWGWAALQVWVLVSGGFVRGVSLGN